MTDANISPVTDANISPTTGANISPTSMPADSMAETRRLAGNRPVARRSFAYGEGGRRRGVGWPMAIVTATAAVVVARALFRWSSQTSVLDKVMNAVTPTESDDARTEARRKTQVLASPGDWLSLALDHHRDIEAAFATIKTAAPGPSRVAAMKTLRTLLTAHSVAEEAVIYPAMTEAGEKGPATMAYGEQALTKTQMAKLEKIDPASQDFIAKVEEISAAVRHHMYEEEATWFPQLKKRSPAADQSLITSRFQEEFQRYSGARMA